MSKHLSGLLLFYLSRSNLLFFLDDCDNNFSSKVFGNFDNLLLILSVAVHSKFLTLSMLKCIWVCVSELCSY